MHFASGPKSCFGHATLPQAAAAKAAFLAAAAKPKERKVVVAMIHKGCQTDFVEELPAFPLPMGAPVVTAPMVRAGDTGSVLAPQTVSLGLLIFAF